MGSQGRLIENRPVENRKLSFGVVPDTSPKDYQPPPMKSILASFLLLLAPQ
jgi:hypothetical protein